LVDFEPPPEVHTLALCPDHDNAGLEAIEKAIKSPDGDLKLRRLLPPPGKDWCDCLEFFEERAAIREFDGEEDRQQAESKSWVEAFLDGD
jgi:DNA primase